MKEITTTKQFLTTEDRIKFKSWCVANDWNFIDICMILKISYPYLMLILDGKRAIQEKHKAALKRIGYEI